MLQQLYQHVESTMAELQRNSRLRYGVWAIVLILLIYFVLVQADRVNQAAEEYRASVSRYAKLVAMNEDQDNWFNAVGAEQGNASTLQQLLWQADTVGVAQALLQQSVEQALEPLQMKNVRLRYGAARQVASSPAVWQVQIQVEARYKRGDEVQFLFNLASTPKRLVVDRLELNQKNTQLTVQLSGYFLGLGEEATN